MNKQDDCGLWPAYPANTLYVPFAEADAPKYQGMTIRDFFAAHCMAALLQGRFGLAGYPEKMDAFARTAWDAADALLLVRANDDDKEQPK